ncbi:hypothetical protein AHAS_Ahas14G0045300 [Arachis hypogaea]
MKDLRQATVGELDFAMFNQKDHGSQQREWLHLEKKCQAHRLLHLVRGTIWCIVFLVAAATQQPTFSSLLASQSVSLSASLFAVPSSAASFVFSQPFLLQQPAYFRLQRRLLQSLSQASPKLAGNVNWGTTTVIGIFAGMLYGGSKEAAASVSKDAEVTLMLGNTEDKREQYRLMRDAMKKRFIRVTLGSIVGGVRLGIYYFSFWFNIARITTLARNMMLGSVLGATFCFPLGWLHLKLIETANEGNQAANENLDKRDIKSGVSAAIERLESNLHK